MNEALNPALVEAAVSAIRSKTDFPIQAALVLGSGLGELAEKVEKAVVLDYEKIPGFPRSTVAGHKGRFIFGFLNNVAVAVMQGRFHYYEGHHPSLTAMGVRVLASLNVPTIILTNAAGAVNTEFRPGDIMRITDHLNLMGTNPLIGPHYPEWGDRFPDMSTVYNQGLGTRIEADLQKEGIRLRQGVYAAMSGPSYETPAEIRMLRTLGADAAGMSTVPEAIAARQMNMKVLGFSLITNMGAGILKQPLHHEEVMEIGKKSFQVMEKVIMRSLAAVDAES